MSHTLSTQRTQLRRFVAQDFKLMQLLESDPEVMRYTPMRVALTPEQSLDRLHAAIEKQKSQGGYGIWAVELKQSKDFVGWFMLIPSDVARGSEHPEIGFMIVKKYWGQGYATEVAREIIRYCFEDLKHVGVSAATDEDNLMSMTVLKKLKFQFLRNFTSVDRFYDREIVLKAFQLLKKS